MFERWLRGLARWGDEVMVRAVVAAAEVAHAKESERVDGAPSLLAAKSRAFHVIEAARAWLEGSDKEKLRRAWESAAAVAWRIAWLPQPFAGFDVHSVLAAAMVAGEQPVREAIQRTLVEWALA